MSNIYREHILQKTSGTIRTFLQALATGDKYYRSLHNLTEQVTHQYSGRFLVELLQNAHDVLPESPIPNEESRIAIILEEHEAPFGALYVANDGNPFSPSNFNSLSALGQSDKDPEKSIGNKGIGFRSVLEITREPQIYSRFSKNSPSFDGYCFRFTPTVADVFYEPINQLLNGKLLVKSPFSEEPLVDWTENTHRDLMNRHGKNYDGWLRKELSCLSPYLLPLPLLQKEMTARVASFEKAGFSSVIRLPFIDDGARLLAIKKLAELNINTTLFLERVSLLQLEALPIKRAIRRVTTKLDDSQNGMNVTLELLEDNAVLESKRYLAWNELIGGDSQPNVRDELLATVSHLPGLWKEMKSATISLAVRIADTPEPGYFNIYLPTEVSTGCCAHISAPFFGDMSRTHINFEDKYNNLLLNKASEKAVKVVLESLAGKSRDEGRAIIDILAPSREDSKSSEDWWRRCSRAFSALYKARGGALHEQSFCLSENGWSPLDETSFIPEIEEPRVLANDIWYRHATFSVFAGALESRKPNIQSFFKTIGSDAIPFESDLLDTFESIAAWLHSEVENPDWEGYWFDLLAIPMWKQNPKGAVTTVRRTADSLKDRCVLLGSDKKLHKSGKEHTLFFPPQNGYGNDAANLEKLNIPLAFQSSMAFLDNRLAAHKALRPFFSNGLVQDFRIEDIFKLIISPQIPQLPVPIKSKEGDLCKEILMWAAKLVNGMMPLGKENVSVQESMTKLPVPCLGGWFPASETFFGPGWIDTCGEDLSVYLNGVDTRECKDLLKRLVQPPSTNNKNNKGDQVKNALVLAGVSNGFKCESTQHTLPGLEQYGGLDDLARMSFMRLVFVILSSSNTPLTESSLASSLRVLPWIGCEKNGEIEWAAPEDRWYVSRAHMAGRGWQFAHLNPFPVNVTGQISNFSALEQNLANLGMPIFDPENETDSPRLLNDLTAALLADTVTDKNVFLGHIHDAWRLFRPGKEGVMPRQFIVTKGSAQLHAVIPSKEFPVYVPDSSSTCTSALVKCELPVIEMESVTAKELAPLLKSHFGDCVHLASDMENWPMVEGVRWRHIEGEFFSESMVGWLAPLILTLFAFAGNKASGFHTKSFKRAVQTVRETRICWIDNLEIGLWRKEKLVTSHPVVTFWLDEKKSLVCENSCRIQYSVLSEALEAMLDRSDIKRDLKLVLRELEQFDSPTQENICAALMNSLEIKPHQYFTVVEQWKGDISQSTRLLSPVVCLLKSEIDLSELDAVVTEEGLQCFLQKLQCDIELGQLMKVVCESNDFDELGKRLHEIAGEKFQLSSWNNALGKSGIKGIINLNARNEFRQHLSISFVPLRALLLNIFTRESLTGSFADLSAGIEDLQCPPSLEKSYWSLPFAESMQVVANYFREMNANEAEINALIQAEDLETLEQNLSPLLLDVFSNPFEIQKQNRENLKNIVQNMQRLAIAWGLKTDVVTAMWEQPFDELFQIVWEPAEPNSYRDNWSSTECYFLLRALPHDDPYQDFWRKFDSVNEMELFASVLELTCNELATAEESLETSKERKRRLNRIVTVCGKPFDNSDENSDNLWSHISRELATEDITDIEAPQMVSLKEMPDKKMIQAAFDREKAKVPPKERISKSLEKLIGLTGESWAYHVFLPKIYGVAAINSSCWVSANSLKEYPDNTVDDGFGCDFKIHVNEKTYYIEVKASTGSDEIFQMGVSEIRLAENVVSNRSRRKSEEFLVLHIIDALGVKPQARVLPNPYHPEFKESYQFENAGVRIRYRSEN